MARNCKLLLSLAIHCHYVFCPGHTKFKLVHWLVLESLTCSETYMTLRCWFLYDFPKLISADPDAQVRNMCHVDLRLLFSDYPSCTVRLHPHEFSLERLFVISWLVFQFFGLLSAFSCLTHNVVLNKWWNSNLYESAYLTIHSVW